MTEQTPGPWEVTRGTGERLRVVDASHNVPCIATVHGRNGNVVADANLIAAAPDLLIACESLLAASWLLGRADASILRSKAKAGARAAIKKASGKL
jgi:hypothetical protein